MADRLSITPVRYPIPWHVGLKLVAAVLLHQKRDFYADAQRLWADFPAPVEVIGTENIPSSKPFLLTTNHYTRPGFDAWWWVIALTALSGGPVHWIITAAWTFPNQFWGPVLSPLTWPVFRQVARVYDFITMPPMPPRPQEVALRAQAVRQSLALARRDSQAILGLAPEGRDSPDQALQQPPPGLGRFMALLVQSGRPVLPAAVYESGGKLVIRFGPAYTLDCRSDLPPEERDSLISEAIMRRIASLLPDRLHGPYR